MCLALGACAKAERSLEAEAESLRARVCACADPGCVDALDPEVTRFLKRFGDTMKPDERNARIEKAMDEMSACQQKHLGSGSGSGK